MKNYQPYKSVTPTNQPTPEMQPDFNQLETIIGNIAKAEPTEMYHLCIDAADQKYVSTWFESEETQRVILSRWNGCEWSGDCSPVQVY